RANMPRRLRRCARQLCTCARARSAAACSALETNFLHRRPDLARQVVSQRDRDDEVAAIEAHAHLVSKGVVERLIALLLREREVLHLVMKADVVAVAVENCEINVYSPNVTYVFRKERDFRHG